MRNSIEVWGESSMQSHKNKTRLISSSQAIAAFSLPALLGIIIIMMTAGCSSPHAAEQKLPPPAKIENGKKESELATIKLSAEAEKRLGIETASVEYRELPLRLNLSGEAVIPQGQIMTIIAPMTGNLLNPSKGSAPVIGMFVKKGQQLLRISPFLSPERDLRVQLERDVASLTERVAAAKLRKQRADLLASEKAGSVRAAEQAQEDLAVAETELKASRERLERFNNTPLSSGMEISIDSPISGIIQRINAVAGQAASGGAALLEIASLSTVWIRVPVYVGDLNKVVRNQPARIHGLNDEPGAQARSAPPVNAPPSADASAATADLYYSISNNNEEFRPGQRVGVTLTLKLLERSLTLPWSAILHDVQGGSWVYENTAPQTFVRRPVEVRYVSDGIAILGRAPAAGAKIVTVGAVELFGTEFGAGK